MLKFSRIVLFLIIALFILGFPCNAAMDKYHHLCASVQNSENAVSCLRKSEHCLYLIHGYLWLNGHEYFCECK
jgi:hypothetical protein